ncbi:MAG: monovalent cation/H+ antiporter subunit D family protein [Gemmatimonadetes bacterium]|nr:monovalent cation/H+ antiporter subunit D family protein [Gemmatimonadota bacterium]
MLDHLPILQVLVPLMAAPVAALVRRRGVAWLLTVLATWISLGIALLLLQRASEAGTILYSLGGWPAPWGIEYRVDMVSAWVLVIVSGVGAVVAPYAIESVRREVGVKQAPLLYSALLLCFSGLLGITITGDVFNLFVFLEISSISAYALIAMGPDRRALHAAYKYLIMGSIGATFIVIGIGMMYMMTGTLNMADLATRLPNVGGRTVSVAFAFLAVGISIKLALFPLHQWLPDAYTYAPSAVTAFLASTATKVAVYVLLRVFFMVFGVGFVFETVALRWVLLPLALMAVLSASLTAIYQGNVKRLLAYSSVAQIGYMILGVSLVTVTGLTAGLLHLFNHALIKGALFMAMGAVMYRVGSVRIEAMQGLARRMPWTMAAFVAGGLSLIGVPLTVGFVSKWYLVLGALESGMWWVALLVLLGSLMAVVYIWKVVETAYFHDFLGDLEVKEAPATLLIPMWILVGANFYFGINATATVGVARQAAQLLLGVGR